MKITIKSWHNVAHATICRDMGNIVTSYESKLKGYDPDNFHKKA